MAIGSNSISQSLLSVSPYDLYSARAYGGTWIDPRQENDEVTAKEEKKADKKLLLLEEEL